jgi:GrpB-like predicted nucleotidyltransferase (UPF0157 family)
MTAQPSSGPVELADPSPTWVKTFEHERGRLVLALGDVLLEVHHIGSTAIGGIRAKPIVDIVPVVANLSQLDCNRDRVEALDYAWWGEYGIARRRFCTLQAAATKQRLVNAHFFAHGDPEIERHIAFRDYLRAHEDVAREYAAVKYLAASQHPNNVNLYNDAKAGWIRATERIAIDFYRRSRGSR